MKPGLVDPTGVAADGVVVALLTPAGRGALAVVGVVGPDATVVVDRLFRSRSGVSVERRHDGAMCVGRWQPAAGSGTTAGEELVVVRRARTCVEIHCHGGAAASAAVIASLVAHGALQVSWTEWLARTGVDEIEREARVALAQAGGPRAARILTRQLAGALREEFARITDLVAAGDEADAEAARSRLRRAARVGLRLTRPWRVVLAGAVNAGKSSLVNALAGHARCLVSPQAGTTRDLVETRLVLGGWEVDLVDTAGLRPDAVGAVERAGMARAVAARAEADLVLRVVAADTTGGVPHARPSPGGAVPELLVITKCDLVPAAVRPRDPVLSCEPVLPCEPVQTSAAASTGIETLATRIIEVLLPEERWAPELLEGAVPFTPRQVAALG